MSTAEGQLLWEPSEEWQRTSNVARYLDWLQTGELGRSAQGARSFGSYAELWEWSTTDLESFWASIWTYFGVVAHREPERALGRRSMPGAEWFPGAELNYAEHALRRRDDHPALVFRNEDGDRRSTSYAELAGDVAGVAALLRRLGVERGDCVAAYLPNVPEAVVAFLATASIGAIWSLCAPELGVSSVLDRFGQLRPKVLFAVDGYRYGGRSFGRLDAVAEIRRRLPTVEATVLVPVLGKEPLGGSSAAGRGRMVPWPGPGQAAGLSFEAVPFSHPLWVLYSSGTTGLPKGIVHGHGGVLLEQLKSLSLHLDVTAGSRLFWFTTTGWVMWNRLVSGLLLGATVVLYDGSPSHPDLGALWRLAEEERLTQFGAGAPFLHALTKEGFEAGRRFDLSCLRLIGSTGAPLQPEAFAWVYQQVKQDVLLASISGGTDVCSALVGCCPLLPVHAGEIQCRCLGARVEAYDGSGRPVVGEVGELVVTQPMPSMPLRLWDDAGDRRYRESYFAHYPGAWRQGDWIKVTARGSCVIYGRSDATLNRGGVRAGTSELYRVVEDLPELADSLVVHVDGGQADRLLLFVVLRDDAVLDEALRASIGERIRRELSPRHVPDEIRAVPEVPRTLNGKKLEVPVRRILSGTPPSEAVHPDAMLNPRALDPFVALARQLHGP